MAAGCSTCPCAVIIEPGGSATLFGGAGIGCAGGSGCTGCMGCMGMLANIPACCVCELSRTMDISPVWAVIPTPSLFIYVLAQRRHVLA